MDQHNERLVIEIYPIYFVGDLNIRHDESGGEYTRAVDDRALLNNALSVMRYSYNWHLRWSITSIYLVVVPTILLFIIVILY